MLNQKLDKTKISKEMKGFLESKYKMKFGKKLGEGSYGVVYQVIMYNGIQYAIKIFKQIKDKVRSEYFDKKINHEIKYSLNLRSNYVIMGFKGNKIIRDNENIYVLFMERAKYIDLNSFIYNYNNYNLLQIINNTNKFPWLYNFSEFSIKFFAFQIIKLLEFLDLNLLVHFDFKPGNILLGDNFTIKLSDFSQAKQILLNDEHISLNNGTYHYMAPEFYENTKHILTNNATSVDYFAFGCILFYMISKRDLIEEIYDKNKNKINPQKNDIKDFIIKGKKLIQNLNYSKDLKVLICKLINILPQKRPKMKDLLENEWVNSDYKLINKIKYVNFNQSVKIFTEFQKVQYISKMSKRRKKYSIY